MPGIFGYVKQKQTQANNNNSYDSTLDKMQRAMELNFMFNKEISFSDKFIAQSAIHLHFKNLSVTENNYDLRLEGESYNWEKVSRDNSIKASNFSELLLEAYKINKLNIILKNIDGYFCGSIYDKINKKVLLFCDRWGMRFLYYYFDGDNFAWASEVKGLLGLSFVSRDIDQTSVSCFVDVGYLLSDNTFFKKIKLIKQASIIEFDISSKSLDQYYYWKWSDIKRNNISFEKAVDAVSELLPITVERRFNFEERIGLSLSGGLDSRMIFAALNYLYPNYKGYCYTFGKQGCLDVEIAKLVTSNSDWKHDIFEITSENWFEPRFYKIWLTDGLMNMMHMHGSEFMEKIAPNMDINLNGYAGDAIVGSSFLTKQNADKKITDKIAKKYYKNYVHLADINDNFYAIDKCFPNLFANRVRRFTTMGSINEMYYVDQRKPFLDNELMELIFSLPDQYRIDNKLYSKALLKAFPEYFNNIPWQKTGYPISKRITWGHIVIRFIKKVLRKLNICNMIKDNGYVDYKNWIKGNNIADRLKKLLKYENSIYSKYTDRNFLSEYLEPHLLGKKDNSEYILRATTVAVYLNTIANNKQLI